VKREIANGFNPSSGDDIEHHVLLTTGSKAMAEAARLAWQTAQAMAGEKVT